MDSDDVLADLERQLRDAADRRPSPWPAIRAAAPVLAVAAALVAAVLLTPGSRSAGNDTTAVATPTATAGPVVAVIDGGDSAGSRRIARRLDRTAGVGPVELHVGQASIGPGPQLLAGRGARPRVRRAIERALRLRPQASAGNLLEFVQAPARADLAIVVGPPSGVVPPPAAVMVLDAGAPGRAVNVAADRLQAAGLDDVRVARSPRPVTGAVRVLAARAAPASAAEAAHVLGTPVERVPLTTLRRFGAAPETRVLVLVGRSNAP